MFDLQNRTRFVSALVPALEADGREAVLVVVKATFTLSSRDIPTLSDKQAPLCLADKYYGDPTQSSLRYANDMVPEKRGTDVVLIGSACAPSDKATEVDVSLEAGPLRKTVRAFGDRLWTNVLMSVAPSKPQPFEKMPLLYEKAFGGADKTHKNETAWVFEARNPIGRGLIANVGRKDLPEVPLPNLEDPATPIRRYSDRPAPAGFGFIAPNWEPRKKLAGTYDDVWLGGRCPLLPADFDPRFYNAAHPDLISKEFFRGGERIQVTNVRKDGPLSFQLPAVDVRATFFIDNKATEQQCNLDTVVIEADEKRLMLTWRTKVSCHRKMKYVTGARVTATERKS